MLEMQEAQEGLTQKYCAQWRLNHVPKNCQHDEQGNYCLRSQQHEDQCGGTLREKVQCLDWRVNISISQHILVGVLLQNGPRRECSVHGHLWHAIQVDTCHSSVSSSLILKNNFQKLRFQIILIIQIFILRIFRLTKNPIFQ